MACCVLVHEGNGFGTTRKSQPAVVVPLCSAPVLDAIRGITEPWLQTSWCSMCEGCSELHTLTMAAVSQEDFRAFQSLSHYSAPGIFAFRKQRYGFDKRGQDLTWSRAPCEVWFPKMALTLTCSHVTSCTPQPAAPPLTNALGYWASSQQHITSQTAASAKWLVNQIRKVLILP